jgi:hypothetical protein
MSSLAAHVLNMSFGLPPKLWWWQGRTVLVYRVDGCMGEQLTLLYKGKLLGKPRLFQNGTTKVLRVRNINNNRVQVELYNNLRKTKDNQLFICN